MIPLPTDPAWRARVEETIERLECQDTHFARLALAGWRAHLETLVAAEAYWKEAEPTDDDDAHDSLTFHNSTGASS